MNFEFDPVPVVQEKKKYANFTIREIGGPEEIVKWREMQAAKEAVYRCRLSARDERISQFEAETGQKLASPEVKTASWQEKLEQAMAERKRLAERVEVARESYQLPVEPPKPILQRIIGFFKSIWKNANF